MKVTQIQAGGKVEGIGRKGGISGKAKGQSSQQLRDLSGLKVQMSMDFNHLEVVIFLKAQ